MHTFSISPINSLISNIVIYDRVSDSFSSMKGTLILAQVEISNVIFTSIKSEGYRLIEKWNLIANLPFIISTIPDEFVHSNQNLSVTTPSSHIEEVITFVKNTTHCYYEQLMDITAVDHIKLDRRYEVVYQLLSITNSKRLMVNVFTSEGDAVKSVTGLYSAAGWYERETWDRFGVFFLNHPDLRRILTDYGFKGHPLRKDFPVTGFVEVRYSADSKSVIYEKVSLAQASRETIALFVTGFNYKMRVLFV